MAKKLTYDDLADFYRKKTGQNARIKPMDSIVEWAQQQPEIQVNADDSFSFKPKPKKQKAVASVSSTGNMIIGASDVIRWDDVMNIQGHDVKVSKAVELGIEYGVEIATKLKKDLKSKSGLMITFPMMYLMSGLQERLEKVESVPHSKAGAQLLEMVKP